MSRLTVEEIEKKLFEVESRYYKGWRENEYWWRVSGNVHPTDRRLWTRYMNLLNKIKEEEEK